MTQPQLARCETTNQPVGVLGLGRFGSALFKSLALVSDSVYAWRRCDDENWHNAADSNKPTTPDFSTWVEDCQVICICVQDDQIQNQVSRLEGMPLQGKTVLMHAGSLNLQILKPLEDKGAIIGKFHPLMAFSQKQQCIPKGTPFAFEGAIEHLVRPWVNCWEGQLYPLTGDAWQVYHLAAVIASNFLPLFIRKGARLLTPLANQSEQEALTWLAPLVKQSVANALDATNSLPFSGPAARNDGNVLAAQQVTLAQEGTTWANLYSLASKQITQEVVSFNQAKKT